MTALMSRRKDDEGKAEQGAPSKAPFEARMEGVPFDLVLTTVRGRVEIQVDEPSDLPFAEAEFRIDDDAARPMERAGQRLKGEFDADRLGVGEHRIEISAKAADGTIKTAAATFRVRQSSL